MKKKLPKIVTLRFLVTATVKKIVEVDVDTTGLDVFDDVIEDGRQLANEQFDITSASDDEKYTQDADFIDDITK